MRDTRVHQTRLGLLLRAYQYAEGSGRPGIPEMPCETIRSTSSSQLLEEPDETWKAKADMPVGS